MRSLLNFYENLFYNRYVVKLRATNDVIFNAWPGAIIRNNLLYATEQIRIQKTGLTLRDQIDTFPLKSEHPLYSELKEGFPKGYVLTDFSHFEASIPCGTIRKDEEFSFALLLIGQFNDYRFYFFEAIREMCKRGFGKPLTPFQLIDIEKCSLSPVSFSDFLQADVVRSFSMLTIRLITPTILHRLKGNKITQLSYQDKTNRFPGFYQLTRSLLSRMQKLYALYVAPSDCSSLPFAEEALESFLAKAGLPFLQAANITFKSLPNTLKKEKKNEMPLTGYIGEQTYAGYFEQYLPLLQFMSEVGVGNDTVYGLGRFEVSELFSANRITEKQKNEVESEVKALETTLSPNEGDLDNPITFTTKIDLERFYFRFKNKIKQCDIPLFIEEISKNSIKNRMEYHRNIGNDSQYCYPLVQIKRMNGQLVFVGIGEGANNITGFFSTEKEAFIIDRQKMVLDIETMKAEKVLVQAWENTFTYSIQNYLPLSSDKYVEYQTITAQTGRIGFMEKNLKSNLLFFANSIGVQFDREIECVITELEEKAKVKYKNHPFVSFNLQFRTNVSLPDYIGLGLGVSQGFGTIKRKVR